jgi:flagellar basal-body rod modification protein FlgD
MSVQTNVINNQDALRTFEKASKANDDMGQDAFLHLLTAQLQHQDPLKPMEDKEFTAQLAQFSQLEELNNIGESINMLVEQTYQQELLSAVNFIGKDITAKGKALSVADGKVSTLHYELQDTSAKMYMNIYDANGNIIESKEMPGKQAGEYTYQWDGTDSEGNPVPDGTYQIYMAGETGDGKSVMVDTQVSGTVGGVEIIGGAHYLRLEDGRLVNFWEVQEVVGSGATQSSEVVENPEQV